MIVSLLYILSIYLSLFIEKGLVSYLLTVITLKRSCLWFKGLSIRRFSYHIKIVAFQQMFSIHFFNDIYNYRSICFIRVLLAKPGDLSNIDVILFLQSLNCSWQDITVCIQDSSLVSIVNLDWVELVLQYSLSQYIQLLSSLFNLLDLILMSTDDFDSVCIF